MLLKEYTWEDWKEARQKVQEGGKQLYALQQQFSVLADAIAAGMAGNPSQANQTNQKDTPKSKAK